MYAKKFLNAVDEKKSKDTTTVLNDLTKGTMTGAAIGAGIGLFIGFGRNKNLLMSGFLGAFMGGAISRIFIFKKK
jgi:hypothetical protein